MENLVYLDQLAAAMSPIVAASNPENVTIERHAVLGFVVSVAEALSSQGYSFDRREFLAKAGFLPSEVVRWVR